MSRLARRVPGWLLGLFAVVACSGDGPAELRWDIKFTCPEDAERTSTVETKVLRDGCNGSNIVYEATLTSGVPGPEDVISPGNYSFKVTALDANGSPVASACQAHELPAQKLELWLASPTCDTGAQADSGP
jgi:hypothetical protein